MNTAQVMQLSALLVFQRKQFLFVEEAGISKLWHEHLNFSQVRLESNSLCHGRVRT